MSHETIVHVMLFSTLLYPCFLMWKCTDYGYNANPGFNPYPTWKDIRAIYLQISRAIDGPS